MIDAALAFTGHGVILGFKAGTTTQHFEIAWAPSLTGTFRLVGRPDIVVYGDTVENYEFLTVDGSWDLVATSNTLDQPFFFTLAPGDPANPMTWLQWSTGRELMIPSQAFNTGQGSRAWASSTPTRLSSASGRTERTTSPTQAARSSRLTADGVTPESVSPGVRISWIGMFRLV